MKHSHRILTALIVVACFAFATSCKAIAKITGGNYVAVLDVRTGEEHPGHGRTNGTMSLYKADKFDIVIRVLNSDGLTVVEKRVQAGKIGLVDRSRKYSKTFEPGELLPIWCLELFPDGGRAMAVAMGFTVEPDPINQ